MNFELGCRQGEIRFKLFGYLGSHMQLVWLTSGKVQCSGVCVNSGLTHKLGLRPSHRSDVMDSQTQDLSVPPHV